MSKKKKPKYGVGQVVEGEILTLDVMDWSDCITNPEEWTHGPVRPVTATEAPSRKKRRASQGRKKRSKR